MKKISLYISALLLATCAGFTSCNNEEDDLFPESAANRLSHAVTTYSELLTSDGGKWQLQYFPQSSEEGFVYLMTFNADGSVKISGDNVWISRVSNPNASSASYGSETSLWQVIDDNSVVLSFNSYNRYFHLFADPEDIPTTDTNENGYGHRGDYEFNIKGTNEAKDTVYLEGKKHGIRMNLIRMPASTDDQAYLTSIATLRSGMFSTSISPVYVYKADGTRLVLNVTTSNSTMEFSYYPEGSDAITNIRTVTGLFTANGLRFYSPLDTVTGGLQNFVIQQDGSLLCTDDGVSRIAADSLSNVLSDQSRTWRIDPEKLSGAFADAYASAQTGVGQYSRGSSLQYMQLTYDASNKSYALTFRIRLRQAGRFLTCNLYCTETLVGGDKVRFAFDGTGDRNALLFYNNVDGLKAFVEAMQKGELQLSATSAMAPTTITAANGSDSFAVNLQ